MQNGESLSKCIDDFIGELALNHENEVSTLQKCKEIFVVVVEGLLNHPLDYCVKAINKVFFFNIEARASSDLDDLKSAKQP